MKKKLSTPNYYSVMYKFGRWHIIQNFFNASGYWMADNTIFATKCDHHMTYFVQNANNPRHSR